MKGFKKEGGMGEEGSDIDFVPKGDYDEPGYDDDEFGDGGDGDRNNAGEKGDNIGDADLRNAYSDASRYKKMVEMARKGNKQAKEVLKLYIDGDNEPGGGRYDSDGKKVKDKKGDSGNKGEQNYASKFINEFTEENFNKAVGESVGTQMQQFENRVMKMLQPVFSHHADSQLTNLRKIYPDFKDHEAAVYEEMQTTPGISAEQAYKLVTYGKIRENVGKQMKAKQHEILFQKKGANSVLRQKGKSSKTNKGRSRFGSFKDAFNYTMENMD
jgi:hypothetical protein